MSDPRRQIPRTDALLALPAVAEAGARTGTAPLRSLISAVQQEARDGLIEPAQVEAEVLRRLPTRPGSLTPVINATGIVVHTNIGRAPLSRIARRAIADAAGYVDVEMDLATGARSRRGAGAIGALLAVVPEAGGALVVNNGAAALVLATTALAAGREVIVSRGEMIEIGDGFRLPDLIASTGARLREVGTTNRTHLRDYADAVGPETGCILKVHPSNFRVDGFTSAVGVSELTGLGLPVVMDIGSGLLRSEPALPDEPDAASMLAQGATVVTASGDKLLGGPQAGIILGAAEAVERLRRHPLARALRVDKLTLAGIEATVAALEATPVRQSLRVTEAELRERTVALAEQTGYAVADVVAVSGRVGGGGAPEVPLPGWALALPESIAVTLRTGSPAVLARIESGRSLVDLRCVPPEQDGVVAAAIRAAAHNPDQ